MDANLSSIHLRVEYAHNFISSQCVYYSVSKMLHNFSLLSLSYPNLQEQIYTSVCQTLLDKDFNNNKALGSTQSLLKLNILYRKPAKVSLCVLGLASATRC